MSTPAVADHIYVPDWSFADKFRKARLSVGMEQREFAAALGLTASTVASYETGRSNPRFRVAADLAKRIQLVTRIDYRWFLDFGSAPAPEQPPTDYQSVVSAVTDLAAYRDRREAFGHPTEMRKAQA